MLLIDVDGIVNDDNAVYEENEDNDPYISGVNTERQRWIKAIEEAIKLSKENNNYQPTYCQDCIHWVKSEYYEEHYCDLDVIGKETCCDDYCCWAVKKK